MGDPLYMCCVGEELINTTMIWFNWIPHLRLLRIGTQMLLKLVLRINLNGTINQFSSLQKVIVYQPDNIPDDDTLTAITRLGMLSSLQYTFMFKNIKC
jgi:hypothetical protein